LSAIGLESWGTESSSAVVAGQMQTCQDLNKIYGDDLEGTNDNDNNIDQQ